jgi:hypothetical protein
MSKLKITNNKWVNAKLPLNFTDKKNCLNCGHSRCYIKMIIKNVIVIIDKKKLLLGKYVCNYWEANK